MKIKSGFVAIVGRPNTGKSTLINALIKEKVSIVSPKAQTTRNNIIGILNDPKYQIIFIDTPGRNSIKNKLDIFMQQNAQDAVNGTDVILVTLDSTKKWDEEDYNIVKQFHELKIPIIVVVTKIDAVDNVILFEKLKSLNDLERVKDIVPISSIKNKNLDTLIDVILKNLPEIDEKNRYYPEDIYTDKSERFLVSEIIREKSLYFLNEEIPHGIAVEIVDFEQKNNIVNISADIICEKQSHKSIIIGAGGGMLKKIGHASRVSIQKVLRSKVDLQLFVKVKPNWRGSQAELNNLGYKKE